MSKTKSNGKRNHRPHKSASNHNSSIEKMRLALLKRKLEGAPQPSLDDILWCVHYNFHKLLHPNISLAASSKITLDYFEIDLKLSPEFIDRYKQLVAKYKIDDEDAASCSLIKQRRNALYNETVELVKAHLS